MFIVLQWKLIGQILSATSAIRRPCLLLNCYVLLARLNTACNVGPLPGGRQGFAIIDKNFTFPAIEGSRLSARSVKLTRHSLIFQTHNVTSCRNEWRSVRERSRIFFCEMDCCVCARTSIRSQEEHIDGSKLMSRTYRSVEVNVLRLGLERLTVGILRNLRLTWRRIRNACSRGRWQATCPNATVNL